MTWRSNQSIERLPNRLSRLGVSLPHFHGCQSGAGVALLGLQFEMREEEKLDAPACQYGAAITNHLAIEAKLPIEVDLPK